MSGIWGKIFESLASDEPQRKYVVDFPVQTFVFSLTVWASYFLGGILAFEQYFGKRIFCYKPVNFTESADIVSEHCWETGVFTKQVGVATVPDVLRSGAQWLLHVWVYFILKALILQLPHVVWRSRYEPIIRSVTQSTEELVKQLTQHWLKFSENSDEAYRRNRLSDEAIDRDVAFQTALAMTRDVVNVTKRQIPHCAGVFAFNQLRWMFQILCLCVFAIVDCIFLLSCSTYSPSDFLCYLPNKEYVRCIVPHVTILWYGQFLSFVCTTLGLVILTGYMLWLIYFVRGSSSEHSVLEWLPMAEEVANLNWRCRRDRRIYRFLCALMLLNPCILQPLQFMRALVEQLRDDRKTVLTKTSCTTETVADARQRQQSPPQRRAKRNGLSTSEEAHSPKLNMDESKAMSKETSFSDEHKINTHSKQGQYTQVSSAHVEAFAPENELLITTDNVNKEKYSKPSGEKSKRNVNLRLLKSRPKSSSTELIWETQASKM